MCRIVSARTVIALVSLTIANNGSSTVTGTAALPVAIFSPCDSNADPSNRY